MRGGWFLLLGGLILWAAHFLALYALAETLGRIMAAQVAIVVLTLLALLANAALVRVAMRMPLHTRFDGWLRSVAMLGAGLSAIAICWQTLPAFI